MVAAIRPRKSSAEARANFLPVAVAFVRVGRGAWAGTATFVVGWGVDPSTTDEKSADEVMVVLVFGAGVATREGVGDALRSDWADSDRA